jgi:hypothetical protein
MLGAGCPWDNPRQKRGRFRHAFMRRPGLASAVGQSGILGPRDPGWSIRPWRLYGADYQILATTDE